MKIDVQSDLSDLTKDLTRLQRDHIPFATARALSDTAWNARVFAQDGMVRDLDKVKAFTLNAFKITNAKKTKLTASIELKPIQAEYLSWAIEGGRKTSTTGISVPFRRKRMTISTYNKWIARDDTFEGTIKGLRGLWQRIGRYRVKLLFAHEPSVDYKPGQWAYYNDVRRAIDTRFPIHFNNQMNDALKKGRG